TKLHTRGERPSSKLPFKQPNKLTSHFESITTHSFFFNDTPTTEIYTLSLHDALPIAAERVHILEGGVRVGDRAAEARMPEPLAEDRKSTRLNSSHDQSSYAVFCLKKKKYRKRNPCIAGYRWFTVHRKVRSATLG